jgi:GNAT superfamily N-acetyltransferase
MTFALPLVSLSTLDEERFGVKTAKCSRLGLEGIPEVMAFCRQHQVELLIARSPTTWLSAAQEMERQGFLLMDVLIYFSRSVHTGKTPRCALGIAVRECRPGDEHAVKSVAEACFRDYQGHYHTDSRLDRTKCNEIYADWAYRSCLSDKPAEGVLVATIGKDIVGFGTMRENDARQGEGLLFCVSPAFRRRGVYRTIMIHCLHWCTARGLKEMTISTQITNLASQRVWLRLGFEPVSSFYTFHRWFV